MGRFIAVYRMISAQMLSSMPIFATITYRGMIAATIGSIFVLMKKNSASWVLRTGRSDNAKAAGTPSRSTNTVETMVANAELSSAVLAPVSKTDRNWSRVGVKKNFGGSEYASDSCLKAVSTIQNTGKKNPIPAIQAMTPHGSSCGACVYGPSV